jgi:hypothetical protein
MSLPVHWPNTSRTCRSTAINNIINHNIHKTAARNHLQRNLPGSFSASGKGVCSRRLYFLPLLLLLTSCTSIRPIVKIGLIAPFEGLYRESGYAALGAMRQALADCTPSGLEVMPLALDDSGDPAQAQRAAQKLLVDPTVAAVIGPLLLDAVPAVTAVMTQASDIPWLVPALVAPAGGFAPPQAASWQSWLESQVEYIATNTPTTRILLLGLPAEWPFEMSARVPVLRIDELDRAVTTLEAGDAILWVGRPDVGARWLSALRLQQPKVAFWLAEQGGIDIFAAHTTDLDATYWLVWTDHHYNQWLQAAAPAAQPNDFTHYLTYRATCVALSNLADSPSTTAAVWQLQRWPIEHPNADDE